MATFFYLIPLVVRVHKFEWDLVRFYFVCSSSTWVTLIYESQGTKCGKWCAMLIVMLNVWIKIVNHIWYNQVREDGRIRIMSRKKCIIIFTMLVCVGEINTNGTRDIMYVVYTQRHSSSYFEIIYVMLIVKIINFHMAHISIGIFVH